MSDRRRDRAVSEVLGYSLIFGMILVAIAIVSVAGFASLEDARNIEQQNNAERAFDVLSNNVEDVYKRGAPSRATELSLGGAQLHLTEPMTMRVDVDGTTVVERDIRPLVFRGDDDVEFVYEAGAVFRNHRQGGVTVRDPPLRLESERMIFTVVATNSSNTQSISGPAVLVRTLSENREVVVDSDSVTDVTIELEGSPRQELWQHHLEDEHGMSCTPSGDTLTCTDNHDPDRVLIVVHDLEVELET